MDFNVNIPEWENEGTEPNEELIQGGFEEKYKPPANIFNWFWHKVTTGVAELQSKLSGEETARISADNTLQSNINAKADSSALTSHTSNTSNPHSVTKSQVGLGNVDNTSDINKPVSTAMQTALDGKADKTEIIPNNDTGITATMNNSGWYRIGTFSDGSAVKPNSCEIIINRMYQNTPSEYHHIYYSGTIYQKTFTSFNNNTSSYQQIDKIRYSIIGGKGYIDIHAGFTNENPIQIKILNGASLWESWQIGFEYVGTSDIEGQVVYDIPANSELAQKEVVLWSGEQEITNSPTTVSLGQARSNFKKLALSMYVESSFDWYQPMYYIDNTLSNGKMLEFDVYSRLANVILNSDSLTFEDTASSSSNFDKLKIIAIYGIA